LSDDLKSNWQEESPQSSMVERAPSALTLASAYPEPRGDLSCAEIGAINATHPVGPSQATKF